MWATLLLVLLPPTSVSTLVHLPPMLLLSLALRTLRVLSTLQVRSAVSQSHALLRHWQQTAQQHQHAPYRPRHRAVSLLLLLGLRPLASAQPLALRTQSSRSGSLRASLCPLLVAASTVERQVQRLSP